MRTLVIVSLLLVFGNAYANSLGDKIWLEKSINGRQVECPNAIKFHKTSYEVFNDCYGNDPKSPIVETGQYTYINNTITFRNRKTQQAGLGLIKGNMEVTGMVKEITKNNLKLKINNEIYLFVSK